MTSLLFTPLQLGDVEIPNRAWLAPMCQYMATDGVPGDWHHVHLAAFANGGFGLVMTEATAVSADARITPEDTGIWNDPQAEAWQRIVESIHDRGALAGIQLGHAGRKASTWRPFEGRRGSVSAADGGWSTLAPSPLPFDNDYELPAELTEAGIRKVVTAFAHSARLSARSGFDVIEVHAAHGYLLHQFLSPLSNHRKDKYGGSLRARAQLLLDVVAAVRRAAPAQALFVRLSATEWEEGGITVTDTTMVAEWLHQAGADLLDISTAGNTPHPSIPTGPAYQVPAARQVGRGSGMPVSAVGLITTGAQAESILIEGGIDAIMIGRAALGDPHWAVRAAADLGEARPVAQPPHRTRHPSRPVGTVAS